MVGEDDLVIWCTLWSCKLTIPTKINLGIVEGRTISSSTLLHFKYPRAFKANRVRERGMKKREMRERIIPHRRKPQSIREKVGKR